MSVLLACGSLVYVFVVGASSDEIHPRHKAAHHSYFVILHDRVSFHWEYCFFVFCQIVSHYIAPCSWNAHVCFMRKKRCYFPTVGNVLLGKNKNLLEFMSVLRFPSPLPLVPAPRKMKKWFCDWTVLVISEATRSCVTRSRYHWQQFPEYVSVWRIGEGQGEAFAVNDSWNAGVAWLLFRVEIRY